MEDFEHRFRQVVRFRKFEEGGGTMKDQDNETRIDEDVEGHGFKANVKQREDENDVEGHAFKAHVKPHVKP
jgi:hypothetical protein